MPELLVLPQRTTFRRHRLKHSECQKMFTKVRFSKSIEKGKNPWNNLLTQFPLFVTSRHALRHMTTMMTSRVIDDDVTRNGPTCWRHVRWAGNRDGGRRICPSTISNVGTKCDVDLSFDFSASRDLSFVDEKTVKWKNDGDIDSISPNAGFALTMTGVGDLDGDKAAKRPAAERRSPAADVRGDRAGASVGEWNWWHHH